MKFIFASLNNQNIRVNKATRYTFVPDGLTANQYREEKFWKVEGSMFDERSWKDISH